MMRGHAIECRINAEAAHKKFAPAPGRIGAYLEPSGPGVRVDSGLEAGGEVTPLYDPMVAKLITWDVDRETATRRMIRALGEYEIEGLTTLIPFHETILATEQWARGRPAATCSRTRNGSRSLPTGDPAPARGGRRRGRDDRARVQGRGRRPALSGQGHRSGARRQRRGPGSRQAAAEA